MEEQSDGSIIVSGLCTSDTVDLDDQIIDLDFSRKGLAQWAATFGNIRQMHSTNLPPAGKAIQIDTTKPDGVYLTARIVEPGAVKLCKEGVYSAFSVGISKPRIVRDKVAKQGRVLDGVFSEVAPRHARHADPARRHPGRHSERRFSRCPGLARWGQRGWRTGLGRRLDHLSVDPLPLLRRLVGARGKLPDDAAVYGLHGGAPLPRTNPVPPRCRFLGGIRRLAGAGWKRKNRGCDIAGPDRHRLLRL